MAPPLKPLIYDWYCLCTLNSLPCQVDWNTFKLLSPLRWMTSITSVVTEIHRASVMPLLTSVPHLSMGPERPSVDAVNHPTATL